MMASFFQMNTASSSSSRPLPSNTIANPKGESKAITTRSGLVLDGPSVPMPPPFINSEEDERADEILTDPELAEYTIKVPPPLKMVKALLSNKEKLLELVNIPLNENYSAVILKKLPEKLGDPGKFLIICGFIELKCKALADLGASINLMPLLIWKKLGLPELISTRMTLELANRAICTPARIARDVFIPVGKFTFLVDFVIVDSESDPRVPLILGRPFIWTDRALIDVYGEKMILRDEVINPLSDNTTYFSPDHSLEEFADELALITFPLRNDDLPFDIESDLREIEFCLTIILPRKWILFSRIRLMRIILQILIAILLIPFLRCSPNEHTLDYSSPPLCDDVDADLVELESDNDDVYDDTFDSKEEKIKESKLLMDKLDPPRSSDFLPSPNLVSKFINEFVPPSRTTNLRNEISNFQQRFDESFHEAWDRYKDLLRACPHHGFTELHQLDTIYNALNLAYQDSLNSTAGGNLLERRTQDVLTIIENKSTVRNFRDKSIVSQVKSSDAFVKAVEEICVTCGGAHLYYQCLAADGNTFSEFQDNIQGYVFAAAVNYNHGNFVYRPPIVANQNRPLGFAQPNVQNNQKRFSQPQGYNRGNNFNQDTSYQAQIQQNQIVLLKHEMASFFQMNTASSLGSGPLPSNTIANPKGKLKAITTRSGLVLDGPSVPMPPPFINPKEDEIL
uniref:Reverse transcriptase domain-containing protein n=1 Tax=Tanacetum cinerariifolium TaxID=118510 RepID=A0A6L2JS31_TANCI|nr:reverse transcriptase domain-containing protein [Tanacetum cinerariifolium]